MSIALFPFLFNLEGESAMPDAVQECGMVPSHAVVFKAVADKENLVIISRALNVESTPLLLENYAAKGFHVKAKTCNWGPMAGFVCADARFTKNADPAGINWQKDQLTKAFKAKATKTPLIISEKRFKQLENDKKFAVVEVEDGKRTIQCKAPGGVAFTFVAIAKPQLGWAIHYDKAPPYKDLGLFMPDPPPPEVLTGKALIPVYAMVNPGSGRRGHLDAIAGDYDLFGLYPFAKSEEANKHTHRAVEVKPTLVNEKSMGSKAKEIAKTFTTITREQLEKEHEHMGNITPLITNIKTALNTGIKGTGYLGGEIVMHSDESGNPLSSAPDYPLLAFKPKAEPRAIHNEKEFIEFIKEVRKAGYQATLNPRWKLPNFTITQK